MFLSLFFFYYLWRGWGVIYVKACIRSRYNFQSSHLMFVLGQLKWFMYVSLFHKEKHNL